MHREGNFPNALPDMVHAKAMGTQSAIEALTSWKGHFILINDRMHAHAKMVARHPHFQADVYETREAAEASLRELRINHVRVAEADYKVREITDEFLVEFRRVRDDQTTRPNTPQGPNYR